MPLEVLLGAKLIASTGEELDTAALARTKKAICLYFSAHWCPPCRGFTPQFAQAYTEYKRTAGDAAEAEVVFVSWDSDQGFDEYRAEMPCRPNPVREQGAARRPRGNVWRHRNPGAGGSGRGRREAPPGRGRGPARAHCRARRGRLSLHRRARARVEGGGCRKGRCMPQADPRRQPAPSPSPRRGAVPWR